MKTPRKPSGAQSGNHPAGSPANAVRLTPESIDLLFILPGKDGKPVVHLHAEDAVAAGDAYWHTDPLGGERTLRPSVILPRAKRTGKSAQRPGFALWEMLNWLAAAAIAWAIFGAVIFGLMVYATR